MTKLAGCSGIGLPSSGYRKVLDFFEVKDTFLQVPKNKTLERWRELVGKDFVFAIRAWQVITHESDSPGYQVLPAGVRQAMRAGGHFRDCGEVREAWQQTLRAATVLRARAVVFESPASFTPTTRNRSQLCGFFESIERPTGLLLVWAPSGVWSLEEQRVLCSDLGLVPAVDEETARADELLYLRLHRAHYDEDRLLDLSDLGMEAVEAYFAFQGPNTFTLARRLQSLLAETDA